MERFFWPRILIAHVAIVGLLPHPSRNSISMRKGKTMVGLLSKRLKLQPSVACARHSQARLVMGRRLSEVLPLVRCRSVVDEKVVRTTLSG